MIAIGLILGFFAVIMLFFAAVIPTLSPEGDGANPFKGIAFVIGLLLGVFSGLCFYLHY